MKEERLHLEPQMIKIVEWVEKLEELELDLSKGEAHSPVPLYLTFREDETRSFFPNEPAFLIGEKEDPIAIYLSDMFTAPVNLAGIPAISIPVGLSQQKLSLGIQVMGNIF
jgi:hypothetical protein